MAFARLYPRAVTHHCFFIILSSILWISCFIKRTYKGWLEIDAADLLNVVSLTSLSNAAATRFIWVLFDIFLLVSVTLLFAFSTALNSKPKLSETKFYLLLNPGTIFLCCITLRVHFFFLALLYSVPKPALHFLQINCTSHLAALASHLSHPFITGLLCASKWTSLLLRF